MPSGRSTIGDLLRMRGESAANARRQSGAAWSQTAGTLGQIASQGMQNYLQQKEQQPMRDLQMREQSARTGTAELGLEQAQQQQQESQALREYFASGQAPTAQALAPIIGPDRAMAVETGFRSLQALQAKQFTDARGVLRDLMLGMNALPEEMRAEYYPGIRQMALDAGVIGATDAPEQFDPQWWQQAMAFGQQPGAPPDLMQRDPARDLVHPQTGAVVQSADPAALQAATMGGGSDYSRFLARWAADHGASPADLTSAQELQARRAFFEQSSTSSADPERQRREAIEDVRAELRYKLLHPDDEGVAFGDLQSRMRQLGMRPFQVERREAMDAIRREALTSARSADLAGPAALDDVPTLDSLLEAADAAYQREMRGGRPPAAPSAPAAGDPGSQPTRRTTRAAVEAVAQQRGVSYDVARQELARRGVVVED